MCSYDFIILFTTIYYMQQEKVIAQLYHDNTSKPGETSEHSSQMNMETDVNLTKKKRIIFWIYLFAVLCFAITVTVLAAKSWNPTQAFISTDSYYYSYQVAKDWQKGFVTDVMVVNGSLTSCPVNYEPAFNYSWPGSNFGCYCNPNANLSFLLQGYCSPDLIQSGCQNIKNQASFVSNNWKNFGLICLKRSAVSFKTEQKYDGTNKICGSSQSLVIMPISESCPFVNMSFTSFALQDHQLTVNDPNHMLNPLYVSYNSTSPYSFYSYPFIKFKVSQDMFCQIDQDTGINPDHSDFLLLNTLRGCATKGNSSLLDSMTQIDFYKYNPKLQNLTTLPGFPTPSNWNYLLGFQSLTGWTYNCRQNQQKKFSIPNAITQFSFDYKTDYQNFLIGVAVCLIVILLELFILTLRRIVNSAVYPIGYKQKYLPQHFLNSLIRYIIDGCAKITLLGLTLGNLFTIYKNYNWFKSAINLNCADGNLTTLYSILNPFLNLYTQLFNYSLATLVVCIFMIVIDIIHFIYIYRNELTFYLIQTEDKQMVKRQDSEELKWVQQKELFQAKDIEAGPLVSGQNDQFRVTMAQNIFLRDEVSQSLKVKKKKKKKFSPFKKNDEETSSKVPREQSFKILQEDSGFNPYQLDQDPVESLRLQSPKKAPSKGNKKRRLP